MNAVILQEPGRFSLGEVPEPGAVGPGQALVAIRRIGICGTDYHAYRGRQPFFSYPRILGHELAVEILQVGEGVTEFQLGDRCAVEPYFHCGFCVACRAGKTNCCADLKVLGVHIDGGMTERLLLPAEYLHASKSLSIDQLALVETLAIGAHAVERATISSEDTVLVLGAGPIGLGTAQFAAAAGAKVLIADVSQPRLEQARHVFPSAATALVNEGFAASLPDLLDGELPAVVFDATGNAQSMQGAFHSVRPGGRLVYVGLVLDEIPLPDPLFHRREMTLLATRNAMASTFAQVMQAITSGCVDVSAWVTHRAPLLDAPSSIPEWSQPGSGVLKALLTVE